MNQYVTVTREIMDVQFFFAANNNETANVCAGVGTPPDYLNGFDGDLDFFRFRGQWYKISTGHFKVDTSWWAGPYIKAVGGPWPRVLWNADGTLLKNYYKYDRNPNTGPNTGINYINRIKREVFPWMPGI